MNKKSIVMMLLVIFFAAATYGLQAADLYVTTTADMVPGSLRAAITTANGNGEDDTIHLPAGIYVLTGTPDEDENTGGDLDINTPDKISIIGAGKDIVFIDGNNIDRVVDIKGIVSISKVTIRQGKAPAGIDGNYPNVSHQGRNGGGILIQNNSTVELTGCVVRNNFSGHGGYYDFYGPETPHDGTPAGNGGGICNKGTLTLNSCIIESNTTGGGGWVKECIDYECDYTSYPNGDGGGIFNEGILSASKSSINSNPLSTGGNGGGLFNAEHGNAYLSECTIGGNQAGEAHYLEIILGASILAGGGGGIFNSGELTLTQCLINNNMSGGGISGCLNGGDGSGIYNNGYLNLINCTISSNSTGRGGSCQFDPSYIPDPGRGAIYNLKTSSLTNCTVCFNSNGGGIYNAQGTVTIKNTIIAGNHGPDQTADMDVVGNLSSLGYNLIENTIKCTVTGDITGNITGADANLDVLSDNGGTTRTHALLPNSPALDAGSSKDINTDQRGYNRPKDLRFIANADDGSDIGAYENSSILVISGRVTDGVNSLEGVTLDFSNGGGSITTDKNGQYIHIVNMGWSGTVTPSKTDYHFNPGLKTYNKVRANFKSQDYTATPDRVSVKIENPKNGDIVYGIVNIRVSAKSDINNKFWQALIFYIDDQSLGEISGTDNVYWDSTKVPNGVHTIKVWAENSVNQSGTDEISIVVDNKPSIILNRKNLYFGMDKLGNSTGPQSVLIGNSGAGMLNWSIAADQSWLDINPNSGNGNGAVEFTINSQGPGLPIGTHMCKVTVTDPAALNSPQEMIITLMVYQKGLLPFGEFSTPLEGSTVNGSIPVTGWVLDDMQTNSVKIYRDAVQGEGIAPVYIGDAVFVEGARPDVELAYPGYPMNYKAGWGYMILTNVFPNGGNGTFTLHALTTDVEGNQVSLGTKTIICDNANAINPFGAIDTPTQGGTASGKAFVNFSWALTPQPNMIPIDGSTIDVVIDGVVKGHPVYNVYRSDIAALFPGYANTNGAIGYYYLDATKLSNGVHTIAWTVTDNVGNSDGIGSRYFTVQNSENSGVSGQESGIREERRGAPACAPVFDSCAPVFDGLTIEIKELERVEINLSGEGISAGYLVVGDQLRELPIGSTLDTQNGIFYWQPGPGFVGEYRFVFIGKDNEGQLTRKNIVVNIKPRHMEEL